MAARGFTALPSVCIVPTRGPEEGGGARCRRRGARRPRAGSPRQLLLPPNCVFHRGKLPAFHTFSAHSLLPPGRAAPRRWAAAAHNAPAPAGAGASELRAGRPAWARVPRLSSPQSTHTRLVVPACTHTGCGRCACACLLLLPGGAAAFAVVLVVALLVGCCLACFVHFCAGGRRRHDFDPLLLGS